ncbi:MAG: hypothetical protein IBX72_00830 [Nitrospirae bacterium]|nr:hypothetical protein [Nitrospirota bacterium]
MRSKVLIVMFLSIFVFTGMFVSHSYAEKLRIVEGLIENVTDDSVRVRGRDYSIAGVSIKNASDATLTKAWLKTGKRVELFLRNNKLTTILVYEEMVQ